jgi:hypothetical protein
MADEANADEAAPGADRGRADDEGADDAGAGEAPPARNVRQPIDPEVYAKTEFPVDSFKEAAVHLRRPFAPNAIKWKIQSAGPKNGNKEWAVVVAYIDARLVSERLNLVCPDIWYPRYKAIEGGGDRMWCDLTVGVLPSGEPNTRGDIGIGQGQEDKSKGMVSDSLKRAAVHFGVGRPIYALPQVWFKVRETHGKDGDQPVLKRRNDGKVTTIHQAAIDWLTAQYEHWLSHGGEDAFGPYLDHGDAAGSVGELLDATPEGSVEPTAVVVQSDPASATVPVITAAMRRKLFAAAREKGVPEQQLRAIVKFLVGSSHTDRIPRADMTRVLDAINNAPDTLDELTGLAADPDADGHKEAREIVDEFLKTNEDEEAK